MADTIDVDATPIEDGLKVISGADMWLAEARAKVDAVIAQYGSPSEVVTEDDYKEARRCRTAVRKSTSAIDAERKAMLRDFEEALAGFRLDVKGVLAPLDSLDTEYKALIDAYDARLSAMREIELAQEYEAIAPDLVPIVPFSLLLRRYGMESGRVWLNKSTNIVAAKEMLADAVYDIAEGEKAIDSLVADEDRAETKRLFFETLDLNGALASARRAKEQRSRLRAMEEMRRARELSFASEPEQPEQQPEKHEPAPQQPAAHAWYLAIPSATREEMEGLAKLLVDNGYKYDRIFSGTSWELVRREANA